MMNRFELKFRGFDEADGVHRDTPSMSYNIDPRCDAHFIMQFTGQYDIDGKEIYESDIIQNEKGDVAILDRSIVTGGYTTRSFYGGGYNWWCQKNKVLGNIHENPDLIDKYLK